MFEIYLKSAGSYGAANAHERDRITTDIKGYAQTKLLPYGLYTVTEAIPPEGYLAVPSFDVFISENGRIYSYLFEDDLTGSLTDTV